MQREMNATSMRKFRSGEERQRKDRERSEREELEDREIERVMKQKEENDASGNNELMDAFGILVEKLQLENVLLLF